jgi:hypothetical protein
MGSGASFSIAHWGGGGVVVAAALPARAAVEAAVAHLLHVHRDTAAINWIPSHAGCLGAQRQPSDEMPCMLRQR